MYIYIESERDYKVMVRDWCIGFGILNLAVVSLQGLGWVEVGGNWICRGHPLVLAPVVHGVAGDSHRRCHGDSRAAHGELVGDGVIRTAAARTLLGSRGP